MDISFCLQKDCPKKESCRRYVLAQNQDNWSKRQSVFAVDPRKGKEECKLYWEIENE